jgi:hypothetical protein
MTDDAEDYTEEPSDADLVRRGDGRRFKNLCRKLQADMGGALNVGQKWLVRRCVQITLELERLEQARNRGKEIDLVLFGQLTDRLGRTLQRLGLEPDKATPAVGIAFTVLASEPYEPEPVDVTPPVIDAPERIEPPIEQLPPPPDPTPRPLTSAEKMARHDAEMAAWKAREMAKAAQRPASPWTSFVDDGGFGRTEIIRDWSDRRR